MKSTKCHKVEMTMRTQCQRCTSCIVFTSGSLRPVPMRSKRKSYKPSSNLQAIFWQTPSKYRGPHINDMRWKQPHQMTLSRLMAHKKLAKADPKVGSKIHRKNRSHHKGPPLCADKGADAWLASSFAGHEISCANKTDPIRDGHSWNPKMSTQSVAPSR